MADCLTLLRQYNTQKKEIVERDNLVIFDKTAWPKTAKTSYLLYRFEPKLDLMRINWNASCMQIRTGWWPKGVLHT